MPSVPVIILLAFGANAQIAKLRAPTIPSAARVPFQRFIPQAGQQGLPRSFSSPESSFDLTPRTTAAAAWMRGVPESRDVRVEAEGAAVSAGASGKNIYGEALQNCIQDVCTYDDNKQEICTAVINKGPWGQLKEALANIKNRGGAFDYQYPDGARSSPVHTCASIWKEGGRFQEDFKYKDWAFGKTDGMVMCDAISSDVLDSSYTADVIGSASAQVRRYTGQGMVAPRGDAPLSETQYVAEAGTKGRSQRFISAISELCTTCTSSATSDGAKGVLKSKCEALGVSTAKSAPKNGPGFWAPKENAKGEKTLWYEWTPLDQTAASSGVVSPAAASSKKAAVQSPAAAPPASTASGPAAGDAASSARAWIDAWKQKQSAASLVPSGPRMSYSAYLFALTSFVLGAIVFKKFRIFQKPVQDLQESLVHA
jgi:hypothetical protein